jgi:hypothetical protein
MSRAATTDVYLELGTKRVFAGAIEWPGWSRSGRDEGAALATLLAYAPRYAQAVGRRRPAFRPPTSIDDLVIVERVSGDATTDFGAPSVWPRADARPLDGRALARLRGLLECSWTALDRAAEGAAASALRPGPRGGGRALDAIVGHVIAAEAAYVRRIAGRPPRIEEGDAGRAIREERAAVIDALLKAVTDGLPERGPRGGVIWTPRYFVRRAAWHALDHAWEIEDRSSPH